MKKLIKVVKGHSLFIISNFIFVGIFFIPNSQAFSQGLKNLTLTNSPQKYIDLINQREETLLILDRLQKEIVDVSYFDEPELINEKILSLEKQLQDAKSKLESTLRSKTASIGVIESLKNDTTLYSKQLAETKFNFEWNLVKKQSFTEKSDSLVKINAKLSRVENEIKTILIDESSRKDFLNQVAFYFSILILTLIIGIVLILIKDNNVRGKVFGSDTGLQFVTLFCIVIAIILLGLTGVLEGKELSALLGAISGYILGRVTQKPTGTPNNS